MFCEFSPWLRRLVYNEPHSQKLEQCLLEQLNKVKCQFFSEQLKGCCTTLDQQLQKHLSDSLLCFCDLTQSLNWHCFFSNTSFCAVRWVYLWSSTSNHTGATVVHLLWGLSRCTHATGHCSLRCRHTPWRRAPVMHHSTLGECVDSRDWGWSVGWGWWMVMLWHTYNSVTCRFWFRDAQWLPVQQICIRICFAIIQQQCWQLSCC